MTEDKRFTDVWCSETGHIGVTDDGIDKKFTGSKFEDFLNELHEETQAQTFVIKGYQKRNDNLFKQNERLKRKLQRERTSSTKQHLKWNDEAEEQIKELSEENEKLKRKNMIYQDKIRGLMK